MNDFDYSVYYRRFHNESEEHAEQMAALLTDVLRPHLNLPFDANILDVGCGYGFALRALRKLGFRNTLGLEISSEQADVCRAAGNAVELTLDSVAWLRANPASFDAVILLDVLEHVPVANQIDFMRAVHSALNSTGIIILTVPNANAILANRWRYNDYTHCCSFTEHSLYFVLRNAGFSAISIETSRGIGQISGRFWQRAAWSKLRKWIVRWCWLQVYRAELPGEDAKQICFDLNLTARAVRHD